MRRIWGCYSGAINLFYVSLDDLRKNPDKYNWWFICSSNNLSIEFIQEFSNKVKFDIILRNNQISDEVKEFCRMFI